MISAFGDALPAAGIARAAIRKRLEETRHSNVEIFYDPLDFGRFAEKVKQNRVTHFLAEKYSGRRPDVVIALEQEALHYLLKNRDAIAPAPQSCSAACRIRLLMLQWAHLGRT
jgi:hypothetical protein